MCPRQLCFELGLFAWAFCLCVPPERRRFIPPLIVIVLSCRSCEFGFNCGQHACQSLRQWQCSIWEHPLATCKWALGLAESTVKPQLTWLGSSQLHVPPAAAQPIYMARWSCQPARSWRIRVRDTCLVSAGSAAQLGPLGAAGMDGALCWGSASRGSRSAAPACSRVPGD